MRQDKCAVPIGGDAAPTFQTQRLLAADPKLPLDHEVGAPKCFIHIAAFVLSLNEVVVRAGVMHKRRVVLSPKPRIRHRRQRFVVNLDEFHGIFGGGAILSHDGADRLATKPDLIDCEPVLDRLAPGETVGHAAERINLSQKLLARQHFDYSGQFPRLTGVDRTEAGVGMLTAQKGYVVRARQPDIIEEAAFALDQRDCLVRQHRRANGPLIDEARIRHQTNPL